MKDYTLTEQQRIGEALARILQLRRSRTHSDRWQMGEWGEKRDVGVFNTVLSIAQQIEAGDLHNFPELSDIQRRVNKGTGKA